MVDLKISKDAGMTGGAAESADQVTQFMRKDGLYAVPPIQGATPADHGFQAWNYDPRMAIAKTVMVSETVYVMGVQVRTPITISEVSVLVGTAGTGSATASGVGLYNSAGTLLGSASGTSAGVATASAGLYSWTLTAAATGDLSLTTGLYFVAIFVEQASSPPFLYGLGAVPVPVNAGLSAAGYMFSVNGTSAVAVPGSLTPSSNSETNALGYWVALT
jgi:hypothetical protein